jgi:Sec-independent protein secretion pathway component TatC
VNSIIQTKEFKFTQEKQFKLDSETLLEMPISEHIAEFRQRLMHCFGFSVMAIGVLFFRITPIVKFLEAPVTEIKFIQLSPGEYFLSTVKIAFYGGLLISVPFLISQVILYILPGLTKPEKKNYSANYFCISNIVQFRIIICIYYSNSSSIKIFYRVQ